MVGSPNLKNDKSVDDMKKQKFESSSVTNTDFQDRIYIHPSDTPSLDPVTKVLAGSGDYRVWSRETMSIGLINGSTFCAPGEDSSLYPQWVQCSMPVHPLVINGIGWRGINVKGTEVPANEGSTSQAASQSHQPSLTQNHYKHTMIYGNHNPGNSYNVGTSTNWASLNDSGFHDRGESDQPKPLTIGSTRLPCIRNIIPWRPALSSHPQKNQCWRPIILPHLCKNLLWQPTCFSPNQQSTGFSEKMDGGASYGRPLLKRYPASNPTDLVSKRRKRTKTDGGSGYSDAAFADSWLYDYGRKMKYTESLTVKHSDPFSINSIMTRLGAGEYGSVSNEIEELLERSRKLLCTFDPKHQYECLNLQNKVGPVKNELGPPNVIDLDDDDDEDESIVPYARFVPAAQQSFVGPIFIDLDDDDNDVKNENNMSPYVGLNLNPSGDLLMDSKKPSGNFLMKDFLDQNFARSRGSGEGDAAKRKGDAAVKEEDAPIADETDFEKDKGEYVGTEDDEQDDDAASNANSDGLGDIWNELSVALEVSKDPTEDTPYDENYAEDQEECEHSFILKDDIGDVCRICGVIGRGIESIIEYNFSKGNKSTRTYSKYEMGSTRELDQPDTFPDGFDPSGSNFAASEINPHPRHMREMKSHQIEGFNFLLSNLVCDNPGGCIMAHAPGSGKTFMIISFLQSFMAKYPAARPLVVLPRGILGIWKKEFLRWQVEDIPLYDFYSVKADSRLQQLEVLKKWVKERSVLFLGYKQFSSIVCDTNDGQVPSACQSYLLKIPSILILDEGHTPRNQDTDVLTSLERVETTRKVVLSGTLYQNHVKEVFNILNLVRPKFLKMEEPKAIRRRILSRADLSSRRNLLKPGRENEFYDLIEQTLIKDENHTRKMTVIQDLREMTRKVLHYYKGDNLDELPGLIDFSVFLKLSPKQQKEVKQLKTLARKFTISAQGSAIYLHPKLAALAKTPGVKDRVDEAKIDEVIERLDVREGVKLNFYLNLLRLCESSGEKLLVFSQYLLPLKVLERMTAKVKGYSIGREMFMITGDSDAETRESYMETFNVSSEARVFFGSIKACGEGISLVGASRIIILDVHLNPSVTRQAIGRAFRPGQVRKVYIYRLICSGSPEEEDHTTCFRKESIAKMWFEWDGSGHGRNLEMEPVDVKACGDDFLETERLNEDVVSAFKR